MFGQTIVQTYLGGISFALVPTVMFMALNIYFMSSGNRWQDIAKSALISFFTSYLFFYIFSTIIIDDILIPAILAQGVQYSIFVRGLCNTVVFLLTGILFAYIYRKILWRVYKGAIPSDIAFFIVTQYYTIIVLCLAFAGDIFSFNISIIVSMGLWGVLFSPDIEKISILHYRHTSNMYNNMSFIEFVMALVIWFVPHIFMDGIADDNVKKLSSAISVLAVVLYAFILAVHKMLLKNIENECMDNLHKRMDSLTGVYNRETFLEIGNLALVSPHLESTKFCIIYFNVANFSNYNFNNGTNSGDELLQFLAEILRDNFPGQAGIARITADHFAIMDIYTSNTLRKVQSICDEFKMYSRSDRYGVSAGVYLLDQSEHDIRIALDKATSACNQGKKEGAAIRMYDDKLAAKESLKLYVLENLDSAIANGEIIPYYQPIYSGADRSIVSAECLVRWNSRLRGFLSPVDFIPVLEENNLTYKIDTYMVECVCQHHRMLMDMGKKTYPVAINFSRKDFYSIDVPGFLDGIMKKYELPKDLIKVEITESAFVADCELIAGEIDKVRRNGFQVWIDDFGSGYSSLHSVKEFNVDGLKLDMDFLRNMNSRSSVIIKGIIETAHSLGIETVCEGCEEEEHYQILKEVNCDLIQGYLFSQPMKLEDLLQNLN